MLYIFGIITAAIFGYFIAKDANSRGMNGALWGIGSCLALIPVVPLYLIVRKPVIDKSQIHQSANEKILIVNEPNNNKSSFGQRSVVKINKSLDDDAYKIYLVKNMR